MEYLDLRNMTCPMPVIETKKLLENKDIKEIEVLIDNPTSCENVKRFLTSRGFFVTVTAQEGTECRVKGIQDEKRGDPSGDIKKILVYIDGETMGRGNDELGNVLMGAFLKTLKELETRPWRLIFINTGVKLVSRESLHIETLKEIENSGIEILSCGTCVDFFHLKEKIGVGRVSNMFEILSAFSEATNVIRP
jgi:selenium metabolism protein YedF